MGGGTGSQRSREGAAEGGREGRGRREKRPAREERRETGEGQFKFGVKGSALVRAT